MFSLCFMAGCATVSSGRYPASEKIALSKFAKANNFSYTIRTFQDDILLRGREAEIILKLGSPYALINSRAYNLLSAVTYDKGEVYVSSRLKNYWTEEDRSFSFPGFSGIVPIRTIVIDPGHGGKDPGALSRWGLKEKDVNLDIAKRVKRILQESGFRVYLTRERDCFISLKERVLFSQRKKADLFISIHANANRSRSTRGFEVYYLAQKFTDTEAKALAAAENLCDQEQISLSRDLKMIIGDMLNSENRRESLLLSQEVLDQARSLGIRVRNAKGAPFYVLKFNHAPSILVETGYLTNFYEAKMLKSGFYREQIAQAITAGVSAFKDRVNGQTIVHK